MDTLTFYLEPMRAFLFQIGAFVPRLLFATLVVIAGWLIAKVVRFAVIRGLHAINFPVLTERAGIDNFLRQGGMVTDSTVVFGALAYWMVILASLVVAFNGLGLSYVTDLLARVMWFVPNVFVAMLVLAFGAYFARFVGDTRCSGPVNHSVSSTESCEPSRSYSRTTLARNASARRPALRTNENNAHVAGSVSGRRSAMMSS